MSLLSQAQTHYTLESELSQPSYVKVIVIYADLALKWEHLLEANVDLNIYNFFSVLPENADKD